MSKEYGLIVPDKHKMTIHAPGKRAAIFDENSDSDDAESQPSFAKPAEKKKVKLAQEKAIEEDPTVYQYDEIYDDIEKKRNESKLARKDIEKKPKYISNLLRAADRRKRENERRIERQVQKEREAEGDEFKDKESYVTPSYLKKLEEMKELEEKEKREDYLESIGDVTKQGNLDGFYRHLYDQKLNYEDNIKKEKIEEIETSFIPEKNEDEDEIKEESDLEPVKKINNKGTKKRHYRSRDETDSEEEPTEIKKEHMPSNLDADSDFSIDSSDSESEDGAKKASKACENKEKIDDKQNPDVDVKINVDSAVDKIEQQEENKLEETVKEEKISKPKVDIWKKRTVGEVFEEARKRYFERLALRNSGRTI